MNKSQAGKFLSASLRDLANEAHDTDGSETKTRAQCLAQLVWDYALGYTRRVKDKDGQMVDQFVPPQTWAVHLLFDRLEGKVVPGDESAIDKPTLAQRVGKLNQEQFDV